MAGEKQNLDTWNPLILGSQIKQAHSDLQGLEVSKEDALVGSLSSISFNDPIATPELTNLTMHALTSTSEKINPWDSFKSGVESSILESIKSAGMIENYIQAERTPGYSGTDSPIYQNYSDEYKMRYGHLFATSPNEEWSKGIDDRIKKYEELNRVAGANFWSGLAGATVGGLLDPGTLLAMTGGLIIRSAKLGAMGYGYSELRSTVDPTYASNLEANSTAAAMSVLFGNAFHYLGSAAVGFKRGYSDYWTGKSEAPEVTLTDITTGKSTGAEASVTLDSQSYRVAKTNFIGDFLYSAWKPLSAEYRLMDSDINATRYFASQILEPNNRTIKQLVGDEVQPISIVEMIDAEESMALSKIFTDLDSKYVEYRKSGGKVSQEEFESMAGEYLQSGKDVDPNVIQATKAWENIWDNNWKTFKDLGIVDRDAISDRKAPFYANRKVIDNNPAEFRRDLEQQVLSQSARHLKDLEERVVQLKTKSAKNTNYTQEDLDLIREVDRLKSMLNGDRNELNTVVSDIVNKMMSHADGEIVVHGNFKAQTLQKVKFDFDGDFRARWGITNLRDIARRYTHESAVAKTIQERFGTQDVVSHIRQKISDEVEQKAEIILNDPNLSTSQKNKMYADLKKNEIRDQNDILDIFKEAIGKQHVNTNKTIREIGAIAKGIVSTQTLGNRVIGNLSDLAHAQFTHAPIRALGEHAFEVTKEIVNGLKPLSKKELRSFGVLIDDITQAHSSRGMMDDGHTAYSTWTEDLVQRGMEKYNKVQLFTITQNKMRATSFNNIGSDVLEWSARLVDGKLKPDSYEALQLKKYGVSSKLAKQFVSEFDKHSTVENKVVDLNISKWDYDTQIKFGAIVKQRINQHIVSNTPGATAQAFYNPFISVVTQFQKFIHLTVSKILIPAVKDLHGVHPKAALTALVTIATDMFVGVLGGQLKAMTSGKDDVELTPKRAILYALERSTILAMGGFISNTLDSLMGMGAASLMGEQEYSRFSTNKKYQVLGPAITQGFNAINIADKLIHDDMTTREWLELKRLMPFNNFIIYNWYLNKMIKENT